MIRVRAHALPCLFLSVLSLLNAQDYRGKVQGVVTDASQAVVVGATISLANDKTGIVSVKETNPNGRYFFDLVDPGTYTITVEAAGFSKFIQQNIVVQVAGDVTVDASLTVGAVSETVVVKETPVAVQFNTSTMQMTVDRKMLDDLPTMARNPFTMALLDPAVVNRYFYQPNAHYPYFMYSTSSLDVGGGTSKKNDLLLDGAPLSISDKGSYAPPIDAVQEVSIQQNSVDAEYGHSGGGVMNLSMKSGTNEVHGSLYYFGRNPRLNAVSNAVTRSPNLVRSHVGGGTIGGPIVRNKLFNFGTFEKWRTAQPLSTMQTLPTDLERTGDFSQSLNTFSGLRTIYDPWSTKFDPAANKATRTPFPGNRIPQASMDRVSLRVIKDLWVPNNPGDNQTGVNNFKLGYGRLQEFWNFSDRTDWNINDKWKVFGRYSRFSMVQSPQGWLESPGAQFNGGIMASRQVAADVVYLVSPTTVLNLRGSYWSLQDDLDDPLTEVSESFYHELWPNDWYKPYNAEVKKLYYPRIGSLGRSSYWIQHPYNYSGHGRISREQSSHQLKAGLEWRRNISDVHMPTLSSFNFSSSLTADTFISPDARYNGDTWATFLLGALGSDSIARYTTPQITSVNYYGVYIQDDFKVSRNLTLNLGLRYEYESPPVEVKDRISRYLDLTNPIPEMQSNPPAIPAEVRAVADIPYRYNGAWVSTDDQHRGMFDTQKTVFIPRAGMALRLNDRTAVRVGYARYVVPPQSQTFLILGLPTDGFNATTEAAPVLEGIPQARLSDPFPASNPLILPVGKSLGRYQNLGDQASWVKQQYRSAVNDRINFSVQRQLPEQLHVDVTFFMNFGHDLPYSKALNMADPQYTYTHKANLSRTIANPFYGYLTKEKFPGPLRNQARVTIGSLLAPYPQYGSLTQTYTDGVLNRYKALQIKLQRPFSKGYSFMIGYNYNRERSSNFFNSDDQYAERFTFLDSDNSRHRFNVAATYDLPFGRGRRLLTQAHPVLEAVLGGWSTSWVLFYNSGTFLRFGQMIAEGDPVLENPVRDKWFDTSKFKRPEPYTPRTNPYQYEGLTGPSRFDLNTTLAKNFRLTERFRLEFRLEAYNMTNTVQWANPNVTVTSSLFGRITSQANVGREVQYAARLHF
ncbi:MAG: carboxypeptidase regulatory-like domain-containing protein [Bryobacterales bacterium]|nr:carboxypeptidase regulatory-like domain-containing protein [Bryobacterales bacterium]